MRSRNVSGPHRGQVIQYRSGVTEFLMRFVALWLLGLLTFALFPVIEDAAVRGTVLSAATCLRALSIDVRVAQPYFYVPGGASVEIVPECTPLLPVLALWAGILAFPSGMIWRLGGMLGGAVALWIFNVGRVLALIPLVVWAPSVSAFGHVFVLQTLGVLFVCALYALWMRVLRRMAVR